MRTRSNVFTLIAKENTDWPNALVSYQKGVAAMRAFDPPTTEPATRPGDNRSWQYLAAVHGRATDGAFGDTLDESDPLWSKCQHGSWFFFPWHRMYLLTLESFIQYYSGDADWSVPYWYAVDPDNPTSDVLPKAFLDSSGENALFVAQRSTRARAGQSVFGPQLLSLFRTDFIDYLRQPVFSVSAEKHPQQGHLFGFGGAEYTVPDFNHQELGAIESVPHGVTHNYVGSDYDPKTSQPIPPEGWMSELTTAARDPIFWLHHSNIDRLWQMWLDLDPAHQNPDKDEWLNTSFTFPAPDGQTRSWRVGEVLDTTAADLGYEYDTTVPPSKLVPPTPSPGLPPREVSPQVSAPTPASRPQVIGATVGVPIIADRRADIELSPPAVRSRDLTVQQEPLAPQRWLLKVEGVTGTIAAPAYSVYVDLPPGAAATDHPDLRAGTITTFGLRHASRRGGDHGGGGLTFVFDITGVHDALQAAGRWDPGKVNVAFLPLVPPAADDPAFAKRLAAAPPSASDLRAARITVLVA